MTFAQRHDMKKTLLIGLLFMMSSAALFAQIRKIPAEVTDAFAKRYPHAEKVEWRDKLSYFQADFELNSVSMSAHFSSKGEWQSTEMVMDYDDLPEDVIDGFAKSKYEDWEIKETVKVERFSKPLQYRLLVKKSGVQKKYLFFNTDGKLEREALTL